MTTRASVAFDKGQLPWAVGETVYADGSDVVIGTVIATGELDDGRPYAELELTPAALGVGYEAIDEDAFG